MLCAAALAAGCGGGGGVDRLSKAAYERKVQSIYAAVQAAFRRESRGRSLQELARHVPALQKRLREGADELERVLPPKEVEGPNHRLAEGLRVYADDLEELETAAQAGNSFAVRAFNENVRRNEAIEQIAEAAEAMIGRGYDLGPLRPD